MNYYYKLITKQDVTKSFVVNKKAVVYFFKLKLINHGEEDYINLDFNNNLYKIKLVLHQDVRILIQNKNLKIGEIAFFNKIKDNHYALTIISETDKINHIKTYLNKNNFYLSNTNINSWE